VAEKLFWECLAKTQRRKGRTPGKKGIEQEATEATEELQAFSVALKTS
jgi:hypothetical protein